MICKFAFVCLLKFNLNSLLCILEIKLDHISLQDISEVFNFQSLNVFNIIKKRFFKNKSIYLTHFILLCSESEDPDDVYVQGHQRSVHNVVNQGRGGETGRQTGEGIRGNPPATGSQVSSVCNMVDHRWLFVIQ